ncbi:uncharacterized protein LOC110433181 isoform X3 [Sorghum bicolor]|uniref:uncharacterized protein LOC110433181 isoform X3 n=1 Tax=Sorghum bicolor TaxID=4558 RepID=UPI000B424B1D|nr:uncharacterized protein LOC110433181 isoform X3 [Sorghum bicolor]|eukprot:XP_021310623.1 uncharacterized protein LOC110433181 isoform X3 [Sorghum bicolor]
MSVPVGPLLIVILLSWCALSTRLLYCFRLEHMDGDLVQRSKAIGFCYINSTMFFFMYANLNKSPAYGMSTELTMPTYNKGMHIYNGLCNHICSSSGDWSFLYSGKSNINEAIAEQPDVDNKRQFLDSLKKETQKKLCESGKDPAVVTKISVSEGL